MIYDTPVIINAETPQDKVTLQHKVALITGGARGIGKAITLKFAREGYHVVINYFGSEQRAIDLKEECELLGVEVMTHRCNVSNNEEVETMIKAVIAKFGSIDVLVNNAGITKDNLLLRMTEDDFDAVVDTNLKGTFLTSKHVVRHMMKQRCGSIVNLSSVVGVTGNVGQANYAASKAGVIGFTKAMAKEVATRQIRVNAIAPGYIVSDMSDAIGEALQEKVKQAIPMQSFGQPEDVANVVYFLSSEQAKYITGQVIHVDGGMVM